MRRPAPASVPASSLGALLLAALTSGCSDPAQATVVSAEEVFVLEQSPAIVGRDGALSGLVWGRAVWTYGDTVLTDNDDEGTNWHHNSFSITEDLDASDGITGFHEPADASGAPLYLVPPTEEEAAFNAAHRGDPCAEAPCGARWAAWPGAPLFDAARDRALIFYGLIYAEPGDFNFRSVGQSIAVWSALDAAPERPVLSPEQEHPTLLFHEGEPAYGVGAAVEGEHLYSFACGQDGFAHPCTLARVPLATALDRSTWEYWDGDAWAGALGDAEPVLDGAPILSAAWNEHLGRWTAVYSAPLTNDVVMRTAPSLTGPWSDPLTLFVADRKTDEGWVYDASIHPEYAEEGGRVQYVSFSRPTGEGWFGAEIAVVRVEFQ